MSGSSGVSTPTMQEQDSTEKETPSTLPTEPVASSSARNCSVDNKPPPSTPSCLSAQQRHETRSLIAEILEQAKSEIFKAFDLGISPEKKKENAQEQEENQIDTPPDHQEHNPFPRNNDAMAKRAKRRLMFFGDDDGSRGKKKKVKRTVPGAQVEQPFLDLTAYPFLRETLKLIGFVKESVPNAIESSKLKEFEDKLINSWEEQMQLSLKISELILELRRLYSAEAIHSSSPKQKG